MTEPTTPNYFPTLTPSNTLPVPNCGIGDWFIFWPDPRAFKSIVRSGMV